MRTYAMLRLLILLSVTFCECVHLYSSFWAPKPLNYKVDVEFDLNAGQQAAENYEKEYGYRGGKLIADLGNGKGPGNAAQDFEVYGYAPKFYTVPATI